MNRRYFFLITVLAASLAPRGASAGSVGGSASAAGVLVAMMILLFAVICFFLALKVFSLLKGGELASAWQMLAVSFMILLIAEAVKLIDMLNVANLGDTAAMLIRLIGIAAVMIGISKIKKALS